MKKIIYITLMIFASCGTLNQSKSLSGIKMQVEKIENSNELISRSSNLSEYFINNDGLFQVGRIKAELKKITVTTNEYNDFQKTTIYLQKEKPILIRKEQILTMQDYLTDGNLETKYLNYQTDFYITDWENGIFERFTPSEFLEVKKNIAKNEIMEYINLAKNVPVN